MSLYGQLLAAFSLYGLPVLFGVVMAGSAGVPVPGVLLVIAAGAFVQQGEMSLWPVLVLTCAGAVVGDSLGYAIGRYGGRRLVLRILRRLGGESRLPSAEAMARRWGGLGIFLSRWLITPVGSTLNLVSGMADYPYPRFLLFDAAGEAVWTLIFVWLGALLSDRIAGLMDLVGEIPWVVLGLLGAIVFGRALYRYLRHNLG